MEALQSFDNQEQIQHNPEKEKQAIEWDYNNTLDSLSSAEFSTTDIQDTISMLSENNPIIASKLSSFQLHNTSALENMLASHTENIQECSIEDSELSDYFWIESLSYFELKEQLDELWLDITVLMTDYHEHIENKLWDLPQEVKQKVILSIWMRISSLSTVVADIYNKSNSEDFKNNRWIINSKLQEELWFVNNELLPSLEAYSKIQSGTQVPDKYNQTIFWEVDLDNVTRYSRPNYSANPDYINMDFKLKEVEQLMWAKIDEDWDFVEAKFWLYTQSIFDMNKSADNNLMSDLWVQQIDASLLSPEDMKIEEQAMLYFMAAIAVQVWVETVWAIPGMVLGWWVDLYDTFSSEETLLKIVQAAGLVSTDFKMEKTWVDNVLAWLWLIPWATQIIKGSKLAKYMVNVDMKVFEWAKLKIKEKLWIAEALNKFSADETQRLNMAENLLWRKLDYQEKNAIIEAHNYWSRWIDWKYSHWDLKMKLQILQNNNISSDEAKVLIREWICWNDIQKWVENLYNDERYSFLSPHKEILWENLSMNNILWEWVNGIVLRHPIEWTVVKIRKPGMDVDDIGSEIENHEKVGDVIRKGKEEWLVQTNIIIPEIVQKDPWYLKTYFVMEKVEWQTISSKIFRNEHVWLKTESPDLLDSLTDREIIELMIEKYWSSTESLKALRESNSDKYLKDGINKEWWALNNALQYLKENGIEHTDLHTGNVMIDKDWNIYIIDFWTMKNIK